MAFLVQFVSIYIKFQVVVDTTYIHCGISTDWPSTTLFRIKKKELQLQEILLSLTISPSLLSSILTMTESSVYLMLHVVMVAAAVISILQDKNTERTQL